jgi:hypothetical protein
MLGEMSECHTSDLSNTRLFWWLTSDTGQTTLLCNTLIKSFFNILNVDASPTFSKNRTKYPGLLWFLEIWNGVQLAYRFKSIKHQTMKKMFGVRPTPPPLKTLLVFSSWLGVLYLGCEHVPATKGYLVHLSYFFEFVNRQKVQAYTLFEMVVSRNCVSCCDKGEVPSRVQYRGAIIHW